MNRFDHVLAIETSCDDTSVAIVAADGEVKAMVAVNQDQEHRPFGGIVPEIASRNHSKNLLFQLEQALEKAKMDWSGIDGLAITSRPGLVGSLLVGVITGKTLAMVYQKPFVGVNHLEGHILAPLLRDQTTAPPENFSAPFLSLVVSGGHSSIYYVEDIGKYRLLGETVDDAAGEAFDKFAKMAGLGFPGGIEVDRRAQKGNAEAYLFPRGKVKGKPLSFTFSGLKSSAQRKLAELSKEEIKANIDDLCASYQQAIVDALIEKMKLAIEETGASRISITGGVSANSGLRRAANELASQRNLQLALPALRYCTDNAAMIGYAGILKLRRGEESGASLAPSPHSLEGDFVV